MKNILCVLAILFMVPGMMIHVAAEAELPFKDVSDGRWYYEGIRYVYFNSIMTGVSDVSFGTNASTTRAMVVATLYSIEGKPSASKCTFSDVSSSRYYYKAVSWASSNNIVSGYIDNTFRPNDDISRQQLVAILYKYAVYKGLDVSATADLSKYSDASSVSDYAELPLKWAVGSGFMSGVTDTHISPKTSTTRAQLATVLMQFCKKYNIVSTQYNDSATSDDFYTFISREGKVKGTPANSIIGAEEALKSGYNSIRVSVQRTADGVWVLLHDDKINSYATNKDGSKITEEVKISNSTYKELCEYDFGYVYGEQYKGLKITTVCELLSWGNTNNIEILLEMKNDLTDKAISSFAALISEYGYQTSIWLSAYDMSILTKFNEKLPYANLAYIDNFSEEALNTIVNSGLISDSHRTRIDSYLTDDYDEELISKFYNSGIDIKVGSVYSVEQLYKFIDLKINYIEVSNISNPYSYI